MEDRLADFGEQPFDDTGEEWDAVEAGAAWESVHEGSGHSAAPIVDDLDEQTRTRLSLAWAADGHAERAAAAAAARMVSQLIAVSAPAELIREAKHAVDHELSHAEICFGLAAAYAGEVLEPSAPPSEEGSKLDDLLTITLTVVRDGCIAETLAAIQTRSACEGTLDLAVRHSLGTIAEDELRHARFCWRFLEWALENGGPDVAIAVTDAFVDFARSVQNGGEPHDDVPAPMASDVLRAHGRLPPEDLAAVTRIGVEHVILPCAHELVARHARARALDIAAAG